MRWLRSHAVVPAFVVAIGLALGVNAYYPGGTAALVVDVLRPFHAFMQDEKDKTAARDKSIGEVADGRMGLADALRVERVPRRSQPLQVRVAGGLVVEDFEPAEPAAAEAGDDLSPPIAVDVSNRWIDGAIAV